MCAAITVTLEIRRFGQIAQEKVMRYMKTNGKEKSELLKI
jgi:hypothetical protein